ncbi:MAG: hypothetical protein KDJ86_14425 [Bauldia sp.]|uniref:hypothetical protein n=1 Tax=Bauldia sp. TaxID=2575872 RepID=UPI001D24AFFC|nr:hypothetical protein [Bauldia sp.]MCB1496981.1 hypothetical protein [Bauldia sp.]
MLTTEFFSRGWRLPWRRKPRTVAVFSFRYDAHLVPDLIENLRPMVDGYISYDDRAATDLFSSEPERRALLIRAARDTGARWVLYMDPDQRLEQAAAQEMPKLTKAEGPVAWGFRLRELYAPDVYRNDGAWGRKIRYRLFPLLDGQEFGTQALHEQHYPKGYERRKTDLNLYHLKMITRERREGRRDLYKVLDPEGQYQAMGYDYLADEEGAEFKKIAKRRAFLPPHKEDGGLWMPEVELGEAARQPAQGQDKPG